VSDWQILLPDRLGEEIAHLEPAARRTVHSAFADLAQDPRAGVADPTITAVEIRRILTSPTPAGERVTVLYRVHTDSRSVEIIWLIAGP
jgi:hypothetical protein